MKMNMTIIIVEINLI